MGHHYHHFSAEERGTIMAMKQAGASSHAIAGTLGRCQSRAANGRLFLSGVELYLSIGRARFFPMNFNAQGDRTHQRVQRAATTVRWLPCWRPVATKPSPQSAVVQPQQPVHAAVDTRLPKACVDALKLMGDCTERKAKRWESSGQPESAKELREALRTNTESVIETWKGVDQQGLTKSCEQMTMLLQCQ